MEVATHIEFISCYAQTSNFLPCGLLVVAVIHRYSTKNNYRLDYTHPPLSHGSSYTKITAVTGLYSYIAIYTIKYNVKISGRYNFMKSEICNTKCSYVRIEIC